MNAFSVPACLLEFLCVVRRLFSSHHVHVVDLSVSGISLRSEAHLTGRPLSPERAGLPKVRGLTLLKGSMSQTAVLKAVGGNAR